MRIGFACKLVAGPNLKTTTLNWLNQATKQAREKKLRDLLEYNVKTLKTQISIPGLQMFRISSDILVGYSHPDYTYFYFSKEIVSFLEKELKIVGDLAKEKDVRLSFHPGQFTCLGSDKSDVRENSIIEFESHVDIIRYLGYGKKFGDFKCNIHIGGRGGVEAFRDSLNKLSREARRVITVENDEFSYGLKDVLLLEKELPIVLDLHHYWVMHKEYINSNDPLVKRVIDSWRGVRPVLHFSQSKDPLAKSKTVLRAHSDYLLDKELNKYCLTFRDFDIMLEAKAKDLAWQRFISEIQTS